MAFEHVVNFYFNIQYRPVFPIFRKCIEYLASFVKGNLFSEAYLCLLEVLCVLFKLHSY